MIRGCSDDDPVLQLPVITLSIMYIYIYTYIHIHMPRPRRRGQPELRARPDYYY